MDGRRKWLARRAVADAECIVAVFDRSSVLEDEDELVAEMARSKPAVAVLNKADLTREISCDDVKALTDPAPMVEVSALTGVGLGELSARIGDLLFGSGENVPDDEAVIFRTRHRDAARRAKADVSRAEEALVNGSPLEIVACDLVAAAAALAEITGEITSEDVLDKVFADFCLGK